MFYFEKYHYQIHRSNKQQHTDPKLSQNFPLEEADVSNACRLRRASVNAAQNETVMLPIDSARSVPTAKDNQRILLYKRCKRRKPNSGVLSVQ